MSETVSSIRISTKLKTDGIAKDRKEIERQLKELSKSAESISIEKDIAKYNVALDKSKQKVSDLTKQQSKLNEEINAMKNNALESSKADVSNQYDAERSINSFSATLPSDISDEERDVLLAKEYDRIMQEIADKNLEKSKEYQKQSDKLSEVNEKIRTENQLQDENLTKIQNKKIELDSQLNSEAKIRDTLLSEGAVLNKKEESLRRQAAEEMKVVQQTKEAEKAAERHNRSIKRGIGKIAKLSLAVIGIRAAYSGIRKIVNSVLDENEKLKNTIDAIWAGLGSAFEPLINSLISGFANVLNYAFAIIKALTGINLIAKANAKQSKKQKSGSGGSKLASFDSSEVLNRDTSSGGADPTDTYLKEIELNEGLLKIIERIKKLWTNIGKVVTNIGKGIKTAWDYAGNGERIMASLGNMFERMFQMIEHIVDSTVKWSESLNFIPLITSIAILLENIEPLFFQLMGAIEFLWDNLLLPLSGFAIESGIPVFFIALGSALALISSVLQVLQPVWQFFWDNVLVPIASWSGGAIVEIIGWISDGLYDLSTWFEEDGNSISDALIKFGEQISRLWFEIIQPILNFLKEGVRLAIAFIIGALKGLLTNLGSIVDNVALVLEGLINFITGVFTGDWAKAWLGIQQIFAGIWNGIIDIVQGVIDGIVGGINGVINALNSISVDIPKWVPIFGGSHFGLNLSTISGPSLAGFKWIPKLAQGAVLPPNKPFVAMLGDQTTGRNLEAPESLIRQIVKEESGSGSSTIVIKAEGDVAALIRFLKLSIDEEEKRTGTKLVLEA